MNQQAVTRTHSADELFQEEILPGVSRTFALTIPQLPSPLRRTVTNAYLLCRIADTIEDDPGITPEEKEKFHHRYIETIHGRGDSRTFARDLENRLTNVSSPQERNLVRHTDRVMGVTRNLDDASRDVLSRRIAVMCRGMPKFQRPPARHGLRNLAVLDQYCYYVAGVVGEMLTELFCIHSDAVTPQRQPLLDRSASFGQGLQMTNILKDVWEDRARGTCWLPRDIFAAHGYDLSELHPDRHHHGFHAGLRDLVGVAHAHLRNARDYTVLVPSAETGIRRFCLWSLVLAALTLRKIQGNPHFRAGDQVKVSRGTVHRVARLTGASSGSNLMVRALFAWATRGLSLARGVTTHQEVGRPLFRPQ